ncbi:hypothetical protein AJ80_00344 [Polytolypa hystricis UAMH7299]|uniref:Uncharacterized protein n=1 Tax=Polytolypa hystricis (strain UAMH7299) TaxID=1447883 RepID=A0A2B7Z5G6_POLH7|nr:hypothetical protein AJ80_00344 [Polytolypa hystricis UAMH7299]
MGLKRKASFSIMSSPMSPRSYNNNTSPITFPGDMITIDESPRHLHSRTRKRFRDDRPDEQTIYDKTLHWLFSAQKQQHQQPPQPQSQPNIFSATDNDDLSNLPSSSPAAIDPKQQTLRKFFQPIISHSTPFSSNIPECRPSFDEHQHVIASQLPSSLQYPPATGLSTPTTGSSYSSMDSGMTMDVDMAMAMDVDSYAVGKCATVSLVQEKRWVGGIGWM